MTWFVATSGWALAFLAAVGLGRMTRIDGTSLNLFWPAAGVAVVWFLLHRRSPVRGLDWLALALTTGLADVVSGASWPLAAGLALADLAQTLIVVQLFVRWSPGLWLNGGDQPFARVAHFWQLAAAAAAGSLAGAAIGPAAIAGFGDEAWDPLQALVWLTRNTVGIVLAGVIVIQLESVWAGLPLAGRSLRRPPWVSRWDGAKRWLRRRVDRHVWEGVLLCAATVAAYVSVFAAGHHLPIGFVLLSVTVWAGLRFSTTFVALHGFAVSVGAVLFTLQREGPFAPVASDTVRALVVQFLIGMICIVGLCLSLGRRERTELLDRARAAEHDARTQADVFATIVESMGAGLVVVGANGEPMLGNLAAHLLTTPSSLIPAPRHHAGTPPPVIDALPYREALAGQVVDSVDIEIPGPGGNDRTLNVSAAPLPARVGGGAVLVFTEVTGHRREREDLAAFAGVVAHDLLTPLTAMSGWADLLSSLLSRAAPDPMVTMATESLTWIQDAATRASTMVGELLDYTTAGDAPLNAQDVSLGAVVAELVAERTRRPADGSLDDTGSPAAEFEITPLGHVLADPVLIRQLLANLIDNAIKYVAPGSVPQIRIGAEPIEPADPAEPIEPAEPAGWMQVWVADHGIGIPDGEHEAIFENFHRAHRDSGYQGSGIGLAICRRIVQRHGGSIRAEDNPGGGTRFVFTLPLAAGAVQDRGSQTRTVVPAPSADSIRT